MNPLKALNSYGQSVWLDYIRRSLITGGELSRLIDDDGLAGVTSNPAIFEKAITGSTDYSDFLDTLRQKRDLGPMALYEELAIRDIQDAADILRRVYDATNRRDGYVSLEVSPFLAHDTGRTIAEARRLSKAVGRDNLMVKVPGTAEGIPAIQQLLSEGISINVTLLFEQAVYERVAHAFLAGLEKHAAAGGDVGRVHSVASFFVSRIDATIDAMIAKRLKAASTPTERALLRSITGKIAISNAKLAYLGYKNIFSGPRWQALAAKGAATQRLLWASTSTKNPSYRDVIYVEELIGPDTVNTIPPATFDAFRDHGKPRASLEEDLEAAQDAMETLAHLGISMHEVTAGLVADGVKLFAEAFDKLLNALDTRCRVAIGAKINQQTHTLPAEIAAKVKSTIDDWRIQGKVRRLWSRDATLWTGSDEGSWLGWLGITEDQLAHAHHLQEIADDVKRAGFKDAVLLGMGGSSLCPEVLKMTFGKIDGFPELHVVDSTDPSQVRTVESRIDPAKTLFIVASKSGSTLEPNVFKQYFFERTRQAVGDSAGQHFIAITDPGSKVEKIAESEGFREVFHGVPSIGGRYSALSDFGAVPAAVMGLDANRLIDRADEMAVSCSACLPVDQNPGVVLGAILGVLAGEGRDKLTLVASPAIFDLGAWLEQLVAESTGKEGKAIIPVDRETPGAPEVYGGDRVFVYLRFAPHPDAAQDAAVDALEKAGHPVVRITVDDKYDLGQEFFRWEIATAVAGSIMGINPFNQPDVEDSKIKTRELTSRYEETGSLPPESPILEENGIAVFTDAANAAAVGSGSLAGVVKAHLARLVDGDYFAVLAYIEMNESNERALQSIRMAVRDAKRVATCLGFGPRFLHSTGQAYKGGPNTGVFLQITCDDKADLPIPGQKYTFGVVKAAQARGDFEVLTSRGRRALRLHLRDVGRGLAAVEGLVHAALR
jgi:transaldolase/glucose-6-phosphate isomerase